MAGADSTDRVPAWRCFACPPDSALAGPKVVRADVSASGSAERDPAVPISVPLDHSRFPQVLAGDDDVLAAALFAVIVILQACGLMIRLPSSDPFDANEIPGVAGYG